MAHRHPVSDQVDPFDFDSSSPEKPTPPSYVATRPNPYTIKSQNTQYHPSLRTTIAPSFPLDPRLAAEIESTIPAATQHASIESLYSSLEVVSSPPRCPSKPTRPSSAAKFPEPTMVKPKHFPKQALFTSVELVTGLPKRRSCVPTADAGATKRQKSLVEPGKHKASSRSRSQPYPGAPGRSRSPKSALRQPPKKKFTVPAIIIREPTPEPEPSIDLVLEKEVSEPKIKNNSTPLYANSLFSDLRADMRKVEKGIDDILSKYLDPRKSAHSVGVELLRYLASSMCKLYCAVEQPHSKLGQLTLRAICSHVFKHTVTGFVSLLDDALIPYAAASGLALVCVMLLQDFDKATDWCSRVFNGPTQAQQNLRHGDLFLNVLGAELDLILERGLAMTNIHNRLTSQTKGSAFAHFLRVKGLDKLVMFARPGSSEWLQKIQLRKEFAHEGDRDDEFTTTSVVRFIGQLASHHVVSAQVLGRWLDRFLVNTACLGIPSMWEIECACALLISVGATLDYNLKARIAGLAAIDSPASSSTGTEGEHTSFEAQAVNREGLDVLNKAMDRVDDLIAEEQISGHALGWLIKMRNLRERGWGSRADDLDSHDDCYSSS